MEAAGKRYIVHGSRKDEIKLWCLADLHLGNRGVAKNLLARDIARIAEDPYSFWIGGGDYADYINHKDKRFDPECLDPETLNLADLGCLGKALAMAVRDTLKPIAHKCLGLVYGNHEGKYMAVEDQADLHAWLCRELDVPNLRYSAMLDVVFLRMPGTKTPRLSATLPEDARNCHSLKLYVHHGAGAAVTKSGKANRLERFAHKTTADVVFVGHCHDATVIPCPIMDTNQACTAIVEKKRLALMTGSYLATYASGMTGYGEIKGYPLSTLGAVWVAYRPETGELRSEVRA